jgi:glycosyltransferase involved in cell wall biosynthesis
MANPDVKYKLWTMGVNIDNMVEISREEARKELGWDMNKKYILYVGKLYKYKQADELIKAWLEIKKTRPETELIVIGNKPNDPWEDSHEMAEKSGALLLGRVLNKDLYKYYSASDVYVMYALREDYFGGTGIAPLESLECNTTVVSNSMRNYIGDTWRKSQRCHTLENYRKAILKVLDNPQIQKYEGKHSKYYHLNLFFKNKIS